MRRVRVLLVITAVTFMASAAAADEPRSNPIEVDGVRIWMVTTDVRLSALHDRLRSWTRRSAEIVAGYYGRFPLDETHVFVTPQTGSGVGHGVAFREDAGIINVSVGARVTDAELRDDWVLVHEMIHLALPNLRRQHVWLSEGISTYVESIARVQADERAAEDVWLAFTRSMPRGLPGPGDRGLDHTHTWARTYWGGALFCLIADVRIRERTDGRRGLQDALAALANASRGDAAEWPIEKAMQVGDAATGTTVLSDLYVEMKDRPVSPDFAALWLALGVRRERDRVHLDDDAPLGRIRRLITSPRTTDPDRPRP